jgi:hypothetical protein
MAPTERLKTGAISFSDERTLWARRVFRPETPSPGPELQDQGWQIGLPTINTTTRIVIHRRPVPAASPLVRSFSG